LLIFKLAEATHIVGGEIYYDNLGGGNYKINMKVYRDCIHGIPPFDGFPDSTGVIVDAYFTVFDAFNNVVLFSSFTPLSYIKVPPSNNSPCAPATEGNACVEEALYETFVNLPPIAGGYYIVYQRCCRNGTILNLINPGSTGATYWEHIPGNEVVAVNNSPRFSTRPPIYICAGIPIAYNHIATDPDGDSLVYSLCTPFNGLAGGCPVLNPGNTICPPTNTPPPYESVPFIFPFTSDYPISSNPAVNINFNTGFLDGVPDITGQWVIGVCVSEYRNGQLIGVHHRDFQFNVINCPFVVIADIISQTTTNNGAGTGFCNGFTISYANNSFNGTSYHWDFGDSSTSLDTSNVFNPTYTFPTIGDYTVTLIADPGSPCADTTFEVFQVHPLLSPDYIIPSAQCMNGNNFNFNGSGLFQGTGTFNWNFGSNATPQTANTATVNNVTFNAPGIYPVIFTVNENGCSAFSTKSIEVYQNPNASIGSFSTAGCDPLIVNFNNTSTAGTTINYLWNFSDGTTSTDKNPAHVFSPAGIYSFSMAINTTQKCIDTSQVTSVNSITVTPTPFADFTYISNTGLCFNSNNFSFTSTSLFQGTNGILLWDFGVNASTQTASIQTVSNITYTASGLHAVILITNENGCIDTTTKFIELYENPIASFDPIISLGCDPMKINFSNTSLASSNMNYLWAFSDGTTSTEKDPIHLFSPPGVYTYSLMVTTYNQCIDTSRIFSVSSITVNPSPVASFTATPIVTTIFDPDIFFFNTSTDANIVNWNYDFGDGINSNEVNTIHSYLTVGDYTVTQTVTNIFACPHSVSLIINILPEFRFWIPNAFTPGNKDNLNDIFKPIVFGVIDYSFIIYDRWGELIYTTSDSDLGWNGTYKNKPCTDDVYVWKCEFRNIISHQFESHVGHVTLVR